MACHPRHACVLALTHCPRVFVKSPVHSIRHVLEAPLRHRNPASGHPRTSLPLQKALKALWKLKVERGVDRAR